ncbi:MAG: DUF2281 domain-containing protein [Chloroflexi bacterium]|nr:DUF2281 domain-containing protein [Chloroflexota bacterium]
MNKEQIWQDFEALPPERRREVADFVAFLRAREQESHTIRRRSLPPLDEEPFIGMWRDREDMQDSTAWVRDLRRRHWGQ